MATVAQITTALFARLDRATSIDGTPQKVVNLVAAICAENDSRIAAGGQSVPVGWVVEAIKDEARRLDRQGQFHLWGAAHIERVATELLGRTSFLVP